MSVLRALPIAALLLAFSSSGAQVSYPIDDFEVQGFDLIQNGPGSVADVQTIAPSQSGHVISSTREVFCLVGAVPEGASHVWLEPGSAADDALQAFLGTGGSAVVAYPLGFSADLTVSGGVDRIAFDITASVQGAPVTVVLVDENDDFDSASTPISAMSEEEILLSEFSGVDLENVVEIIVRLDEPGSYLVREVRLLGPGSQGVDFDIHAEATQTPPLPSPPLLMTLWEAPFVLPLFDLGVSITDASAGFLPELYLGFGASPSFGGQQGHFFLDWTDLAPFEPVDLSFSFEVSAANGLVPELYPPDPVHGPEGITAPFLVGMRDGPGGPVVGMSEAWLTIDPGPLQAEGAVTFENVVITPNGQARGGGGTGFTVSFLLVPGAAGVETLWSILEMRLWLDWTPTVTTGVAVAAPAGETLRLTAAPSVTAGGTEIRASRPFRAPARILVHDVLGRRVASIPAPTGSGSVRWSGRAADGAPVPAGVYFVNVEGERGAATRVVKLR